MAKKKIFKTSYSFGGWNWKKFLVGLERPLVALITAAGTYWASQSPGLAAIISASVMLLHSIIKYYVKEYAENSSITVR